MTKNQEYPDGRKNEEHPESVDSGQGNGRAWLEDDTFSTIEIGTPSDTSDTSDIADATDVVDDNPPPGHGSPEPVSAAEPVEEEVLPEYNEAALREVEIEYDRVTKRLIKAGEVTRMQAIAAYHEWTKSGQNDLLWRQVALRPDVDHDKVFAMAATVYAFKRAQLDEGRPDEEFVKRMLDSFSPEQQEQMYLLNLLPVEYEIDADRGVLRLVFATNDPTRPATLRFVHSLNIEHFDLCYAPVSLLEEKMAELYPKRNEYLDRLAAGDDAFDFGASFEDNETSLVDEEALDAEINRSNLINIFEASLLEAVRLGASDIHIVPRDNRTEFWMRIDGSLQLWNTQDKVHPEAMIAVAKDRCMNIDRFEREAAQDGYIQRTIDHALIRYRVSVLPIVSADHAIKAESIVIRVLDDRNVFGSLATIGLLSGALERFERAIRQPQGMVIMTGPTGSGKSTTLVAALQGVLRPEVNVLTVEDPVEYLMKGVRQIKLGPRLALDGAIRSILRHDPDIVMVGEMRDRVTAELAIKLANTGHLTFSTLHTNDAPSAVSRLYKMGIEPFLIAYAINLIVAQRLLRRLCGTCKVIDDDPDMILIKELGFSAKEISETTFYTSGNRPGCPECNGVNFKGRRAIAEALYFSRAIRHIIFSAGENIDEDSIRDKAVEEGMLTLVASAREIVKEGDTSIEEVIRVTASDD